MGHRVTQAEVARLAATNQTAVSMVLNGTAAGRVAPATIQRVSEALHTSGYLAQRSFRPQQGQVIGIFTYESVFPSVASSFYYPVLTGIEKAAEDRRIDLLLFTSAPHEGGRRRLLDSQLQRVDGCLLLGREVRSEDLALLNRMNYPYVSIGRRDDVGIGPIAYVGADYGGATRQITADIGSLGHRRLVYVSSDPRATSKQDRYTAFRQEARKAALSHQLLRRPGAATEILQAVDETDATCVLIDHAADAEALVRLCRREGRRVGVDLSVVLLHETSRPLAGVELTHFTIPRPDMGRQAFDLLCDLLAAGPSTSHADFQRLFPVGIAMGTTLGPPPNPAPRAVS